MTSRLDTAGDAELSAAVHARDAQELQQRVVKHTRAGDFTAELKLDHALGAIDANIVHLSIRSQQASLQDVRTAYGQPWGPGGERPAPTFEAKWVQAGYNAHGTVIRLSSPCGIAWAGDLTKASPQAREVSLATAQLLSETLRKVLSVTSRLRDLNVRGGGLYVEAADADWLALPDERIEAAPELTCIVCGVPLHWANGHWRDDTGRYDVMKAGRGRKGESISELDHEHSPEEQL